MPGNGVEQLNHLPSESVLNLRTTRWGFVDGSVKVVVALSLFGCTERGQSQSNPQEFPTNPQERLQIAWNRPNVVQIYVDPKNSSIYSAWHASERNRAGFISKLNPQGGEAFWDFPWSQSNPEGSILAKHENALFIRTALGVYAINDGNGRFAGRPPLDYTAKLKYAVMLGNGNVFVVDDHEYYLTREGEGTIMTIQASRPIGSGTYFSPQLEQISKQGSAPLGTTHLAVTIKDGGGFLDLRDLSVFVPNQLIGQIPYKVVDNIALFTAADKSAGNAEARKISAVNITTGAELWNQPGFSFDQSDDDDHLNENRFPLLVRANQTRRFAGVDLTGRVIWQRDENDRQLVKSRDGAFLYAIDASSVSRGIIARQTSPATLVRRVNIATGKTDWTSLLDANDYSADNNQIHYNLDPNSHFGKMLYRLFWAGEDFMILANLDSLCILNTQSGETIFQNRFAGGKNLSSREQADMKSNVLVYQNDIYFTLEDKLFVLGGQTGQLLLERQFDLPIKQVKTAGSFLLIKTGDRLYCLR